MKELWINSGVNRKLQINNENTERAERFTYLGSEVTADGGALEDVKTRIKKANGIFIQLYPLWKIRTHLEKLRFVFSTEM
jgi:hypothetical protein